MHFDEKEVKIRMVIIVPTVFIGLVTLRWHSLTQPMFFKFAFTDRFMGVGVISDLSWITQMQRVVCFRVLEFICLFGLFAIYFVLKWCVLMTLRDYSAEKRSRTL